MQQPFNHANVGNRSTPVSCFKRKGGTVTLIFNNHWTRHNSFQFQPFMLSLGLWDTSNLLTSHTVIDDIWMLYSSLAWTASPSHLTHTTAKRTIGTTWPKTCFTRLTAGSGWSRCGLPASWSCRGVWCEVSDYTFESHGTPQHFLSRFLFPVHSLWKVMHWIIEVGNTL